MATFLLVYHGGKRPQGEAETKKVMDAWKGWFDSLGVSLLDAGNPIGKSHTVNKDGSVTKNGGANPTDGYSLINANSMEDALNKAKGCLLKPYFKKWWFG